MPSGSARDCSCSAWTVPKERAVLGEDPDRGDGDGQDRQANPESPPVNSNELKGLDLRRHRRVPLQANADGRLAFEECFADLWTSEQVSPLLVRFRGSIQMELQRLPVSARRSRLRNQPLDNR